MRKKTAKPAKRRKRTKAEIVLAHFRKCDTFDSPQDFAAELQARGVRVSYAFVVKVLRREAIDIHLHDLATTEMYAEPNMTAEKIVANLAAHGIQCPLGIAEERVAFFHECREEARAERVERRAKRRAG